MKRELKILTGLTDVNQGPEYLENEAQYYKRKKLKQDLLGAAEVIRQLLKKGERRRTMLKFIQVTSVNGKAPIIIGAHFIVTVIGHQGNTRITFIAEGKLMYEDVTESLNEVRMMLPR